MRQHPLDDTQRGHYKKYSIIRIDGQSMPGKKHHGCQYFTLDLNHDKHAIPALEAYAASCEKEYPLLAEDLRIKAEKLRLELENHDG